MNRYLASKGAFLALNITSVNFTVVRYIIWAVATIIQLVWISETFQ